MTAFRLKILVPKGLMTFHLEPHSEIPVQMVALESSLEPEDRHRTEKMSASMVLVVQKAAWEVIG